MTTRSRLESDAAGARVLNAAASTAGPAEVLEFLLPLWAGAVLATSPTETGLLVAAGAFAALVARAPLGALADRVDRLLVAAGGALLAVVALLGFAAVEVADTGLGPAFAVVGLFGVAGAAIGVGIRSWLAAQYGGDVDAYGVLLTAESQGAGLAYVVAFLLLGQVGFPPVYALGAGACALGAVLLIAARRHATPRAAAAGPRASGPSRSVSGLLALCVVNAAVQSAVVLLLVLHLQRTEQLGVYGIAYVLAPGLVAFVLAPRLARPVSDRLGPGVTLAVSLAATAVLAAGLATSPGPVLCAVLWALAATALAVATPVEQAVLAGGADARVGRAMSRYEMAGLLGATLGAAAAGVLFDLGALPLPALSAAAVLIVTAALAPRAVRAVGPLTPAPSHPDPAPADPAPADPAPADPAPADPAPAAPARAPAGGSPVSHGRAHSRHLLRTWLIHVAVFVVGQTLLAVFGYSWLWELVGGPEAAGSWISFVGRIWVFVFLVDTAIVLYRQVVPKSAPV